MATTTRDEVLAWLEQRGSARVRDGMKRYGIPSEGAYGVPVGDLRSYAKSLGRSHELAAELWATGRYEARMLAAFVDEPARVTPAQMNAWARDFDNWAICDTACFSLFDRSPHAWKKVEQWAGDRREYVKRAAFALVASLTLHDKQADDAAFQRCLPLIEAAASDERHMVKKAVSWALRSVGKRSPELYEAATALATKLAESPDASPRWIGKDALRDLGSAASKRRLAKQRAKAAAGAGKRSAKKTATEKVATGKRRTVRNEK